MASPTQPTSSSRSGIKKLSNGESVIPSSTRADGSVRKEIKVKPGYKPPEDVEVYKNRTAEAWKNRGKGGVPGAAATDASVDVPPHKAHAAAVKNAKRREARKKAAAEGNNRGDSGEKQGAAAEGAANGVPLSASVDAEEAEVDPEAERAKEAKKLAKKLRQARELKDKKDKGDNLLPEQFSKVIKINELIRQLDSLGFDAEGEKKPIASD